LTDSVSLTVSLPSCTRSTGMATNGESPQRLRPGDCVDLTGRLSHTEPVRLVVPDRDLRVRQHC
jgi:hypothetical protein